MRPGRWRCLGVVGATPPLWIPAFAGMTNSESGTCFRTNRSCRLVPARQGLKSRSCGLVQRIGTADSATPHPDPCGGQAPALHFLIPPSTIGLQFGTFRRWRAGIEVDWREHPGSESGTCFRTNRSCRLAPAHQGMKSRSCGLVQRIGAADSATPHPDPSGGQAPALHFLIPPSAIGLQFGTFRPWRAGIEVDWRAHFRAKTIRDLRTVGWPCVAKSA